MGKSEIVTDKTKGERESEREKGKERKGERRMARTRGAGAQQSAHLRTSPTLGVGCHAAKRRLPRAQAMAGTRGGHMGSLHIPFSILIH